MRLNSYDANNVATTRFSPLLFVQISGKMFSHDCEAARMSKSFRNGSELHNRWEVTLCPLSVEPLD